MYKSLLAICLLFSAQSLLASEKSDQAAAAYQLRDYDDVGIQNVRTAIELYDEAILDETDDVSKREMLTNQASAYYFLGSALNAKAEQIEAHETAMEIADTVITDLGVDSKKAFELTSTQVASILNKLDDTNEGLLAEAFYLKGISLAQWGNLNGVATSIGRLPEVLGLMERIEMMGYEDIHQFGPFRTIGRINFMLPKIFGGDLNKSADYLKRATQGSLVEGQRYSANGYNNLYLAETLYKQGNETQAQRFLQLFIDADFETLAEGSEPENREALRVAIELAEDWK